VIIPAILASGPVLRLVDDNRPLCQRYVILHAVEIDRILIVQFGEAFEAHVHGWHRYLPSVDMWKAPSRTESHVTSGRSHAARLWRYRQHLQ